MDNIVHLWVVCCRIRRQVGCWNLKLHKCPDTWSVNIPYTLSQSMKLHHLKWKFGRMDKIVHLWDVRCRIRRQVGCCNLKLHKCPDTWSVNISYILRQRNCQLIGIYLDMSDISSIVQIKDGKGIWQLTKETNCQILSASLVQVEIKVRMEITIMQHWRWNKYRIIMTCQGRYGK